MRRLVEELDIHGARARARLSVFVVADRHLPLDLQNKNTDNKMSHVERAAPS